MTGADVNTPVWSRKILHIGTGSAKLWGADDGPTHLTLVEPNRDFAANLPADDPLWQRVSLIEGRIGAGGLWQRANVPELSSFHPPTGILRFFPGLTHDQMQEVRACDLAEVYAAYAARSAEEAWLVLDVAGDEAMLLDGLEALGATASFQRIEIYCGEQALYAGAVTSGQLLRRLKSALFRLDRRERDYWGRERLIFLSDEARHRLRDLKNTSQADAALLVQKTLEIEQLQKAVDEAQSGRRKIERDLEQARAKRDACNVDLEREKLRYDLQEAELQKIEAQKRRYAEQLAQLETQLEHLRLLLAPQPVDG